MKQSNYSEDNLHDRADRPSAAELRSMAMRQQHQIDTQHQMLAAKEQRLRFLKSQETRNAVSIAEAERLRRLRERVEAQESKLRRLRALRGQVDLQKTYNVTLGNDLDSIRALFSEKEKELTLAVAKVEALTRQLEELRRDRRGIGNGTNSISYNLNSNSLSNNASPAAKELEKLRLELAYRNQLSLQQNARLNVQRETLQQRQIELHSVDKRIVELQSRINKKRILNVQNYKFNAGNNSLGSGSNNHGKLMSSNGNHPLHSRSSSTHIIPSHSRTLSRGNVVAVEPFNHIPVKSSLGDGLNLTSSPSSTMNINDKCQPTVSIATDFMQQQHQQQVQLQTYQWEQEATGNPSGGEEAMLLAPESDEKKLAVRQQQQQQYRSRFAENVGNMTGPGTENASTARKESQQNMLSHDFEMKNNSNPPSSYGNASGVFDIYEKNTLGNESESDHTVSLDKGQSKVNNIGASNANGNSSEKHQQNISSQPKASYNFLQNIPLGNLVVPPRKPINSVAPTLSMRPNMSTAANSSGQSETTGAKITSVTRKVSVGIENTGIAINEADQTSTSSPNNNSRPALPPKPNKPTGIGNVGTNTPTVFGNNNSIEEYSGEANVTLSGGIIGNENDSSSSASFDIPDLSLQGSSNKQSTANDKLPIKAKPLTIRKHPFLEQPKLKNLTNSFGPNSNAYIALNKFSNSSATHQITSKRKEAITADTGEASEATQYSNYEDETLHDKKSVSDNNEFHAGREHPIDRLKKLKSLNSNSGDGTGNTDNEVTRRKRNFISMTPDGQENAGGIGTGHGNGVTTLGEGSKHKLSRRVSFDPLALLLDASLEGELELVEKTAMQVTNPSAANDEGITALHNAICAGHFEIVKFLVNFGCDVNAQDSDGWTPLHCAASCNNLPMVKFLVESGACLFAATLSDHETPAEKCEEDEEGFDGCSEYLYSIQEKLGILNNGEVHAVFSYESQQPDELSFFVNDKLTIIRKGDEAEREWWWARNSVGNEGYVPRNLLGAYSIVY
uniref:SH3 domain-containing protein n=1 Tax=Anopheles christyi TaxID=43041 RepID=A0A182KBN7_9DIPT